MNYGCWSFVTALLFHQVGPLFRGSLLLLTTPALPLLPAPPAGPFRHIIIDIVEALAWRWPIKPVFLNYVLLLKSDIELCLPWVTHLPSLCLTVYSRYLESFFLKIIFLK